MAKAAATQTLSMSLEGDKQLQAAIEDIVRNTRDLREPWKLFYRQAFYDAMDFTFKSAQGGTWRNDKARYLKWKRARYPGRRLMELTGETRRELTSPAGFFRPERRQMEIGGSPVGSRGRWNSPNTPKGRMVVWAQSPWMSRQMTEAAREHAEWYAKKWGRR